MNVTLMPPPPPPPRGGGGLPLHNFSLHDLNQGCCRETAHKIASHFASAPAGVLAQGTMQFISRRVVVCRRSAYSPDGAQLQTDLQ